MLYLLLSVLLKKQHKKQTIQQWFVTRPGSTASLHDHTSDADISVLLRIFFFFFFFSVDFFIFLIIIALVEHSSGIPSGLHN